MNLGGSPGTSGFRICATGVVGEADASFRVVKKLKLTGTPLRVHRNTAFVQGMFNSVLEVARFEGAAIRTVSGIRGQIKKAAKEKPGAFRATFEDRILMSDIVFLRSWVAVEPPRFYNPVTDLLAAKEYDQPAAVPALQAPPTAAASGTGAAGGHGGDDDGKPSGTGTGTEPGAGDQADRDMGWVPMRTVREIRAAQKLAPPVNPDSEYTAIVREKRKFNPLRIPKTLQAALPFKSKPKLMSKRTGKTKASYLERRAVVVEGDEKKRLDQLRRIKTIRNERTEKKKEKRVAQLAAYAKTQAKEEKRKAEGMKKSKKRVAIAIERSGKKSKD
jgi:ribosome biogenesis protein BMS1